MKTGQRIFRCPVTDSVAVSAYSAFTNCPFSPHFSHFWGLQRPSLLNPQVHFQVAMYITSLSVGLIANR
jgi:hypothetical protein